MDCCNTTNSTEQRKRKAGEDVLQFYQITSEQLKNKIADPKTQRRGGGVIILLTNEVNGQQGFLLAKSRKNISSDMGGSSSSSEITLKEAAIRELREETCNTFTLANASGNTPQLRFEEAIRVQNYICYIVHIKANLDTIREVFHKNVKTFAELGEQQVPRCWRGKIDLVFIPIDANTTFKETFDISSEKISMVDQNGNQEIVRDRTAIIIHSILVDNIHQAIGAKDIKLVDNGVTGREHPFEVNKDFAFTMKTSSFEIQP